MLSAPAREARKEAALHALEDAQQGRIAAMEEVPAFLDAWARELLSMGANAAI